ncbi:MAG: ECF transporter S component [Clostridia bacterium]|nr:ECF transporter S component [Clostridia bacterium]
MKHKITSYLILLVLIPLSVISGMIVFSQKQYIFSIIAVSTLSVIAFLLRIEKNKTGIEKAVIIAVITALSVLSRAAFQWAPSFKPVMALVVITGMYLGKEAGFMCGAFTALLSNFIFGQGPWTPFQMLSWGIIGVISSMLSEILKKNVILTATIGGFLGVLYSLLMDVYTVLWIDSSFVLSRYVAVVMTSIPVTITYVVSNIIFLLILAKPVGKQIERVMLKYNIKA